MPSVPRSPAVCCAAFIYIHYRSKVWDHLEMTLFFKEKHCFFNKVTLN